MASTLSAPFDSRKVALSEIVAVASFSSTTFKATAPAIATSPVPEPEVAAAVMTFVTSELLSASSWLLMPAFTDRPDAVISAPLRIIASFVEEAIFKPTPPPIL